MSKTSQTLYRNIFSMLLAAFYGWILKFVCLNPTCTSLTTDDLYFVFLKVVLQLKFVVFFFFFFLWFAFCAYSCLPKLAFIVTLRALMRDPATEGEGVCGWSTQGAGNASVLLRGIFWLMLSHWLMADGVYNADSRTASLLCSLQFYLPLSQYPSFPTYGNSDLVLWMLKREVSLFVYTV